MASFNAIMISEVIFFKAMKNTMTSARLFCLIFNFNNGVSIIIFRTVTFLHPSMHTSASFLMVFYLKIGIQQQILNISSIDLWIYCHLQRRRCALYLCK